MRTRTRTSVATALPAAALALAVPLASLGQASAEPAPARHGGGRTIFIADEKSGDVHVSSKKNVRNAVVKPRSIDLKLVTYTLDADHNRFVLLVKGTNFVPDAKKNGFTTIQYVDTFFSYTKAGKTVDAFGMGVSNRHPQENSLGATDAVSRSCARSVNHAPTTMNVARNVVRISVSLDCIPAGVTVNASASSSLWVNPENPPNTQVANDYAGAMSFTRIS